MRRSRGTPASWQPGNLLQQRQETWHFRSIVPVRRTHFRDVTLTGLYFGRMALAEVGNFRVYQSRTWRPLPDSWLHLSRSVSALLISVPLDIGHDFDLESHRKPASTSIHVDLSLTYLHHHKRPVVQVVNGVKPKQAKSRTDKLFFCFSQMIKLCVFSWGSTLKA